MELPIELIIKNKCVVLSPHIDDVAFSLGAALLDNRFTRLTVVNVFSVSNCTIDDNINVVQIAKMRKREDIMFFNLIRTKIKRLYLNRLDAPLRLKIPDDLVFSIKPSKSNDKEIGYLITYLKRLLRNDTLLLAPLGLGGHVDHLLIERAALMMMGDGCATAFYEDLPYAGDLSMSQIEKMVGTMRKSYNNDLVPCILQSKSCSSRKIEAISIYSSQIDNRIIENIISHGERLGNRGMAERIWCTRKALKLIEYSAMKNDK